MNEQKNACKIEASNDKQELESEMQAKTWNTKGKDIRVKNSEPKLWSFKW